MKKIVCVMIAAVMVLTVAFAGIAAAEESNYSVSELNVAIWDNNQLNGLQQIADEWSKTSGVKVNINVINWNEYWTLLASGAQGGQLPDVFWMHINEIQQYMDAEMLLNLDEYIAADDKIDLSNYYEGIVDLYSNNGSQYALPKDHDTIAVIYNKSLFDKYGVDYPKILCRTGDVPVHMQIGIPAVFFLSEKVRLIHFIGKI